MLKIYIKEFTYLAHSYPPLLGTHRHKHRLRRTPYSHYPYTLKHVDRTLLALK